MSNDASVSSISSSTHYDDSEKESGVGDESTSREIHPTTNNPSEATTALMEPQAIKVYYYLDKEKDPFSTVVNVPLSQIRLKDFKATLSRTNFKYFNHIMNDGIPERTEVKDDNAILLPDENNRIFMTLLTDEQATPIAPPSQQHLVPLRKLSQAMQHSSYRASRISKPPALRRRGSLTRGRKTSYAEETDYGCDSYARGAFSDDESSVFTEFTSVSQQRNRRLRHTRKYSSNTKNYHHRRMSPSFVSTSFSDASMRIDVIEVTFDLTQGRLGIRVAVNEEPRGFCIMVAEIDPNSLAARDKRIRKNMIILEVNEIRLCDYPKEQAVDILQHACNGHERLVHLTFAQTERERFAPLDDTVYPIDTSTWVKQTTNFTRNVMPAINEELQSTPNAMVYNPCCLNAVGFPSSGVGSSVCSDSSIPMNMTYMYQLQPKRFKNVNQRNEIAVAMVLNGGLELKHKKNGKKTFASTEMVDWLRSNVHGLEEQEKCLKFASKLVEDGLIKLECDKNEFFVTTEGYYYFTDKLKKLAFKHRSEYANQNQMPAMDDTLYVPQKGFAAKLKRFFCAAPPRQPPQPQQQAQHIVRHLPHQQPSAVRQLHHHDENTPPMLLPPPQLPLYKSAYAAQPRKHTYID